MAATTGFLLVDKPLGVTSFDVVAALRRALSIRKVGHSGTLDPQASGLMLIGFGPATRLLSAFHSTKTYRARIRLGASTDTGDSAGSFQSRQDGTLRERVRRLAKEPTLIIRTISHSLVGEISQVPSRFSAIRVEGRHAYQLARRGKAVTIPPRRVRVDDFEVDPSTLHLVGGASARRDLAASANPRNTCDTADVFLDFDARIVCSEGTYVRSLARDLGRLLKVGGYVLALRRTRIGRLTLKNAIPLTACPHSYTSRAGRRTRLVARAERARVVRGIIPAAPLVWTALPAARISVPSAHRLETGLPIALDAPLDANSGGKSVLAAPAHTCQPARPSLLLGPQSGCLVTLCGVKCVGVAQKRRGALFPRTILDQTYVRLKGIRKPAGGSVRPGDGRME